MKILSEQYVDVLLPSAQESVMCAYGEMTRDIARRHAFYLAGDGVTLAFCSGAPLHSERNSSLHVSPRKSVRCLGERRANYNVARMLNAIPFPRNAAATSERRFRAILRFGSYVTCLSGVIIGETRREGGYSEGENSCAFSLS